MFCLFAAKGGVGCSVVAAAVALLEARKNHTLLVDLGGDLGPMLGVECPGPGLAEWFRSEAPPADALHRLEVPVTDRLSLLPAGVGGLGDSNDRYRLLAGLLAADGRRTVVDVGTSATQAVSLLNLADRSTLVTRACYLALRRARAVPPSDDVILVTEPRRSLRASDVSAAVGAPVAMTIPWDPSVARAVDAGLLTTNLPRPLTRLAPLCQGTQHERVQHG